MNERIILKLMLIIWNRSADRIQVNQKKIQCYAQIEIVVTLRISQKVWNFLIKRTVIFF
jgi:hypothetical protein